jgi:hypothetical protein
MVGPELLGERGLVLAAAASWARRRLAGVVFVVPKARLTSVPLAFAFGGLAFRGIPSQQQLAQGLKITPQSCRSSEQAKRIAFLREAAFAA